MSPSISMKNRASPPQDGRPACSSPIQFNSILARQTAFRLKEFFFKKYLSAARVALKLRSSWIAQRQETKGNVSIKWIPVHSSRLFYT